MFECYYMGVFALGQMIIPAGFAAWWLTCVYIPSVFIDLHNKLFRWRMKRRLSK